MLALSPHFTLAEFMVSDTAQRHGIDNTPPAQIVEELKRTASLMEQVRTALSCPITVTSGYRCSALNKLIGSKPNSLHVQGLAADFKVPIYGDPLKVCQAIERSNIPFGKLILEYYTPDGGGWAHIQVGVERKVLTINSHGTYAGLKV